MGFVVAYDPNVLYPSVRRDLLIRAGRAGAGQVDREARGGTNTHRVRN
jgi:hypothetical protein